MSPDLLFTISDGSLQFLLQVTGLILPPLMSLGHWGYFPGFGAVRHRQGRLLMGSATFSL